MQIVARSQWFCACPFPSLVEKNPSATDTEFLRVQFCLRTFQNRISGIRNILGLKVFRNQDFPLCLQQSVLAQGEQKEQNNNKSKEPFCTSVVAQIPSPQNNQKRGNSWKQTLMHTHTHAANLEKPRCSLKFVIKFVLSPSPEKTKGSNVSKHSSRSSSSSSSSSRR